MRRAAARSRRGARTAAHRRSRAARGLRRLRDLGAARAPPRVAGPGVDHDQARGSSLARWPPTVDGVTSTRTASAPAGNAGPPSNSSRIRARARSASSVATSAARTCRPATPTTFGPAETFRAYRCAMSTPRPRPGPGVRTTPCSARPCPASPTARSTPAAAPVEGPPATLDPDDLRLLRSRPPRRVTRRPSPPRRRRALPLPVLAVHRRPASRSSRRGAGRGDWCSDWSRRCCDAWSPRLSPGTVTAGRTRRAARLARFLATARGARAARRVAVQACEATAGLRAGRFACKTDEARDRGRDDRGRRSDRSAVRRRGRRRPGERDARALAEAEVTKLCRPARDRDPLSC